MQKEELEIAKVIEPKKLPRKVKIGIFLAGVGLLLAVFGLREILQIEKLEYPMALLVTLIVVPVILLHELSHGIVFRIYTGIMKFGFKLRTGLGPVFYTTCPGCLLERNKMILVCLAPQLLTIVALAILATGNLNIWLANSLLFFAAFNLAGGCADLYMVFIMLRLKKQVFIEDTGTGAIIYKRREIQWQKTKKK